MEKETFEVTGHFKIVGRGDIFSVEPPPQHPGDLIGDYIVWEEDVYEITGWEGSRCLLGGCNCLRRVGLKAKKL